ncbi:hypothetical protein Rhal01_00374 [Rubritalea halochordaticola]|uniref:Rhodanese domain-containing protein n=1 Tax=Rubritalea halochordaticola TaxID=714537 RepID=A0ABP9UUS0_9BACT
MLRFLVQTIVILLLGALSGVAVYMVVGQPDRSVKCVQADLGEWEVCWDTVTADWGGDVLWIDARSQREYDKKHLDGALLVREKDAENDLAQDEVMQAIGMSGVEGKKLVVYCGTEACGASKSVAEKIRATGFHSEVYTLFGGWKAVPKELK